MDGDGYITADDRAIIGNTNPDFTGSFSSTLSWKGLSLGFMFTGSYGNLFGLKGVNMETGIRNCGGNRNVYIRILQTFSSSNLHSGLETYYEASDWNNYEVIAHSIKGACRNIGAEDIAEKAYQLELAGKRGDDKFIRANHHDFLDEYRELISTITKAIIEFNRPNG